MLMESAGEQQKRSYQIRHRPDFAPRVDTPLAGIARYAAMVVPIIMARLIRSEPSTRRP